MSYKYHKGCERFSKINSMTNPRNVSRVTHKRVVISKRLGNNSEKSCSTGIIANTWNTGPRKTTKSDVSFSTRYTGKSLDYCAKCGDTTTHNTQYIPISRNTNPNPPNQTNENPPTTHKDNTKIKDTIGYKENGRSLKQYYKNENFKSTESIRDTENDFKKMSLDTIKELPETHASDNVRTLAEDNVFEIYSDSEEMGFFDINDGDNIEHVKKFRDDNYFECHSVKSRVDAKTSLSATSLGNHKCVYRFYLNDRLFPVPLSADHHDNVRCVDCHLPMNLKMDLEQNEKSNGTIQAKVKLGAGNEAQDMILFLPVKDSLIIKEKRREIKTEDEVVYFGVIKLDSFGNSVFNSTQPTDSLALKYQKGYKEYVDSQPYKYRGIEKDDVIII